MCDREHIKKQNCQEEPKWEEMFPLGFDNIFWTQIKT
jgi:hypothetical protein